MPRDLLQTIRKRRKVYLCVDYRQEVHCGPDRLCCQRALRRLSVALAYAFQKSRFIAAVVNQHRLLQRFEDGKEFPPNSSLVRGSVRPQTMVDGGIAAADAHGDEIVEVAVGQALDIQIDGYAVNLQFRPADDVDFFLPTRQRF